MLAVSGLDRVRAFVRKNYCCKGCMGFNPLVSAIAWQPIGAQLPCCSEQSFQRAVIVQNSIALEVLLQCDADETEQTTNERSQATNKNSVVRCMGQFLQCFEIHPQRF